MAEAPGNKFKSYFIMEKTAAFAGSVPANYERYLGPFLFEPYALDLVSRLQDKKYPDILEIACGTGRVTAHLARSVKHDTITATDLNPDMITIAKEIVKMIQLNGCLQMQCSFLLMMTHLIL
jgi:SAM-dependent methyltransferase